MCSAVLLSIETGSVFEENKKSLDLALPKTIEMCVLQFLGRELSIPAATVFGDVYVRDYTGIT